MLGPRRRERDAKRTAKFKNPAVAAAALGGAIKPAGDNLLSMDDWSAAAPKSAQAYKDWKAGKRKEEGPALTDKEIDSSIGWDK